MTNPYLSNHRLTIKPGLTFPLAIQGTFLVIKYASAPFTMNFNGGTDLDVDAGWSFSGGFFKTVTLKNKSTVDLVIEIFAGTIGAFYNSPNLWKDAATQLVGSGKQTLAAEASYTSSGVSAQGKPRRQAIVTNLSTIADLQVLDSDNSLAGIVFPRTAWTVPLTGSFKILNPGGNPDVDFVLGETFYA